MAALHRTPGRKVTRRLEEPRFHGTAKRQPGILAGHLAERHNHAVNQYGSDSGGFHAFDPETMGTAGVFDGGPFPDGTIVTRLAWGHISVGLAQRLLEGDGVATTVAYTFAEPVHQTGTRWHIRELGPEGMHRNGGIPAGHHGLCNLSLERGWDVDAPVTADGVRQLLARNTEARTAAEQLVCGGCAHEYLRRQEVA